jgi:quinol monooxygenase YgiN
MTGPVTITLELTLKPEATETFCGGLAEMLKDTAKRSGFRDIRVVRHKHEPNKVLFIETWDSEQAYNDYIAWRTERGDMDAIGGIVASAPKLSLWPTVVASA